MAEYMANQPPAERVDVAKDADKASASRWTAPQLRELDIPWETKANPGSGFDSVSGLS